MAHCDKLNSCISNPIPPAKRVTSDEGVVSEVASDKLRKGQSPDMKIEGVELSKKVSTPSIIAKKTSQMPDNTDIALQSDKEQISSVKHEKVSQSSCTGVLALLPSQDERTSSMTPKKASHTPDSSVHTFKSGPESSVHSVVRTSDDGYNWRKYGQKNVKGNEYIRSYYRCTYPNCQVKRQLERLHDGQITDIVYFGQHDHPQPQANLPLAVGFVVSIVEDRSTEPSATSANDKMCNLIIKTPNKMEHPAVATSPAVKSVLCQPSRRRGEIDNNAAPDVKRQKKGNLDASSLDKSTAQRVVNTVSEVDIVNDGYRWRKYGQKLVKGSPNPRSYYRCSSPGCPAKKHVERASHDPKMVIATYEGRHDHDMPPGRTVTPNMAGQNNQIIALDRRENDTVCLDMLAHTSSDLHGIPSGRTSAHVTVGEQNQMAATEETRESDKACLNTDVHKTPGVVIKSDEQLDGESGSKSEVCDAVRPNLSSGSQSTKVKNVESGAKSEENDSEGPESRPNGKSKAKTEDHKDVSHGPASLSKEQQTQNAEAVHNHKLVKGLQNDDD